MTPKYLKFFRTQSPRFFELVLWPAWKDVTDLFIIGALLAVAGSLEAYINGYIYTSIGIGLLYAFLLVLLSKPLHKHYAKRRYDKSEGEIPQKEKAEVIIFFE